MNEEVEEEIEKGAEGQIIRHFMTGVIHTRQKVHCRSVSKENRRVDVYCVRTSGGTYEELLLKPTASMPMTHEASRSISFH